MEIEVLITFLAVYLVLILGGITLYVIQSLALYTLAKRRGVGKAWLSWIPVGQEWIIGSISDRYQGQVCGKYTRRRKFLLGFNLIAFVLGLVGFVGMMYQAVQMAILQEMNPYMDTIPADVMAGMMGSYFAILACFPLAIAAFVFRCMAMYDIYRSCDPNNATLFLVLGILFQVTEPFFLMSCRNKDLGMPRSIPEEPVSFANPTF